MYNYGLVLDTKGDYESAVIFYNEALDTYSAHNKTKINLSRLYMKLDPPETEKAIQLLKEVCDSDKTNFEANNNLGSAYLLVKDYKNAVLYFKNAMKTEPDNMTVVTNLANAYANEKDYANARKVYEFIWKKQPSNWDACYELAKVCIQQGDPASAEKYLIYLQAKNPEYKTSEVADVLSSLY